MTRFASKDPGDSVVLGSPKHYLVVCKEIEDLNTALDVLKPAFKKHDARLLDYDGEKLVLLVEAYSLAPFKKLPKSVKTTLAKKQPSAS